MASPIETLTTVPGKDVFALHFLRSLSNLTTQRPFSLNEPTSERVRKIKKAAYTTMARAAGGKNRPWSRALLFRLSGRARELKRRRAAKIGRRRGRPPPAEATDRLRRLVPGGGGMETVRLMEETAHYIKCLSMQVKVMQCLVDGLSA